MGIFSSNQSDYIEKGAQLMRQYIIWKNKKQNILPAKERETQIIYNDASKLAQQNFRKSKEVHINPEQVENEKSFGYQKSIIKKQGQYHIIILGAYYAGKKRLINYCVNQNLREPNQHQLQQPIKYYTKNNIVIWYCQLSDELENYPFLSINFFKKADRICILYPDSLKLIENRVKLAAKANCKDLIFIRTKCDQFQHTSVKLQKNCDQEIQADKKALEKFGIQHKDKVYRFSVKTNLEHFDNAIVKKLILGEMRML